MSIGEGRDLFRRKWRVTVNTIEITDLDVTFEIEKSTKDEPNKCELKIWNLTEAQRAEIEELHQVVGNVSKFDKGKQKQAARKQATKGIPCMIEAGYGENNDNLSLLWLGDIRTAKSERHGPDWITELESGDGEKSWQNARVHVSYGPMTPVDTALRAIVESLGLGEGNIQKAADALRIKGKSFPTGTVISGPAARELTYLCRSADLEWSIQDGAIQILDRGKALDQEAILVSASTGMLDSPTVDVDGILTVKILMTPDVRPGRLIVVDAARIKGNYKIEKAKWKADTAGNDWTIELNAQRY
jgi:hypothetical protein